MSLLFCEKRGNGFLFFFFSKGIFLRNLSLSNASLFHGKKQNWEGKYEFY